jgi:hypothetical protein
MAATWWIFFGFGIVGVLAVFFRSNPQLAHKTLPSHASSLEPIPEKKPNPTAPSDESHMNPLPQTLPESITAWDHDTIERNRWCERALDHIYKDRHHGKYNVLGINTALEYYVNLDGVVEEFELLYKSKKGRLVDYRYVVFKKGEVLNLGDGGDINWVWRGTYTRPGVDMISFQERSEAVST